MPLLSLVKDIVCYNQGELVQYMYLASTHHRDLKDLMRISEPNTDEVLCARDSLLTFLNSKLYEISHRNFEYIQKYYSDRNSYLPRVCLKATYNESIVCLFRSSEVNYTSKYRSSSNSGFQFINETGRYFLCNNIPEAAQLNLYRNPRIALDIVAKYTPNLLGSLFSSDSDSVKWKDCWIVGDAECAPEDFYKSTLIVPLTLWNNELSKTFVEEDSGITGRKIYGYLCMDHRDVGYFNSVDVDFMYIVADLMSLFVVTRLNYTAGSQTFAKVSDMLK